jgi:hypothetical protein
MTGPTDPTPAEQFNLDTVDCPECGNRITGIFHEGDSFPRHKSLATQQGCAYPSTLALLTAAHFSRRREESA